MFVLKIKQVGKIFKMFSTIDVERRRGNVNIF